MALGFKVADGYVEVHARYDKGELQRAAQNAADDNDRAFNKERERNAKSGQTRDSNRRIGRQASDDFIRGMREQTRRQKDSPFITASDVRKDMTRLGRVSARDLGDGFHNEVDRDRRWATIGQRLRTRFRQTFHNAGRESAGSMAGAFFTRFIELVSFGQADVGMSKIVGPMSAKFARMGTVLGLALAGALVVQIGNAITALSPLLLGALAALPIFSLIKSGMKKEDGKWVFMANQMGQALKKLKGEWQSFMKVIRAPLKVPLLNILSTAGATLKTLGPIMADFFRGISPGLQDLASGIGAGVIRFFQELKAAAPGVSAGLRQWGIEFPKITAAIGQFFTRLMKDPALVRNAVMGLSNIIQDLIDAAGRIIQFLTVVAAAYHNFAEMIDRSEGKVRGLGPILGALSRAWGPLKRAVLDAWDALKKFASATPEQAAARWKQVVDRFKKIWGPLKTFLKEVWKIAWDKVKDLFNTYVKPWIEGTLKPWLEKKLKAVAKFAFNALVDAAKAELKKLPGKAKDALKDLGGKLKDVFNKAKDRVVQSTKDLVNKAVTFLKGLPGKAASAVSSLWSKMKGKFSDAVSNAKTKAKDLVNGFINKLKELPGKAASEATKAKNKIKSVFSGAASWLVSAGKDIARGLANGISNGISWVTSAAKRLATAAKNAAKSALGISSPSKVFAEEVGKPSAQGIVQGIERNLPKDIPGLSKFPAMATSGSGSTYNQQRSWAPTIHVHVQAGLDPIDAAARRALVKGLYLETEKFRKDYVR